MKFDLTYLLIIPIIFIGILLLVSNALRKIRIRLLTIEIKDLTFQLEENKLMIPNLFKLGYKDIIESKLSLIPSHLIVKF